MKVSRKSLQKNGINYQPQLVSLPDSWLPSTVGKDLDPHVRIRSGSSYGCAGAWRGAASQKGFHYGFPMGFQGNRFFVSLL